MKIMQLFLFVAFSVVVTSGGSNADDHTHTDHGDSSSVHQGGWYCAICELDFDTEQDMDQHSLETDHIPTDHGDSSSVHQGGWYCAICELDFDTEQDMDQHSLETDHIPTDHGDSSSVHQGDYDPDF
jgi:hypothetical protein